MSKHTKERTAYHPAGHDGPRGRAGLAAVVLLVAGLLLLALLVACGSSSSEPIQAPSENASPTEAPAQDGALLLETRCSTCHTADRAKQSTKTADEWAETVDRMIGKGAQLTDAEKTTLVEYLTENYGP